MIDEREAAHLLAEMEKLDVSVPLLQATKVRSKVSALGSKDPSMLNPSLGLIVNQAKALEKKWKAMVKKAPVACASPKVVSKGEHELQLEITVPRSETPIERFIVHYRATGKSKFELVAIPCDQASMWEAQSTFLWPLTGLAAGTNYDLKVHAEGSEECWCAGNSSKLLTASTLSSAGEAVDVHMGGALAPGVHSSSSVPQASAASGFEAAFDDPVDDDASDTEGADAAADTAEPVSVPASALPAGDKGISKVKKQASKMSLQELKDAMGAQLQKSFGDAMPEFQARVCERAASNAHPLLKKENDPEALEEMNQTAWLAQHVVWAHQEILEAMSAEEKKTQLSKGFEKA